MLGIFHSAHNRRYVKLLVEEHDGTLCGGSPDPGSFRGGRHRKHRRLPPVLARLSDPSLN